MNATDAFGFVAAGATLLTFAQRSMLPMRISAILANIFFIIYGWLGSVVPVLTLHAILLPMNVLRLSDLRSKPNRWRFGRQGYHSLIDQWHQNR